MSLDLKQGYFACWSDNSTYFYEFDAKRKIDDNISVPVVYEDLAGGIKAKLIGAAADVQSDKEEDDLLLVYNRQKMG